MESSGQLSYMHAGKRELGLYEGMYPHRARHRRRRPEQINRQSRPYSAFTGQILRLLSTLDILYALKRQLEALHGYARSKVGGRIQQAMDTFGVGRRQRAALESSGKLHTAG